MFNRVASGLGAAALMVVAGAAQAQVFEQDFTQGQPSPGQCTAWQEFSAELVPQEYTLLTLSGSLDPVGVSCSDPDVIAQIAAALNTNNMGQQSWDCDGRTWMTGGCGPGVELSAAGSICQCPDPEYIVRPCIGNENWGGVNGATCFAGSQTIIVEFEAGPPEPTACCKGDASCEMLLPDDCEAENGIVFRNKTCDEVDCEGACCLPDDTCEVLSQQACGDAGGRYNRGLACENVNCEIPSFLMSTNQSFVNNPRARSFGYIVTERSITDIVASQDLAGFDVVWINPNVSADDAAQLRAGSAENGSLDTYVKDGGTLIVNIAGNEGDQDDIAPGGTDYSRATVHEAENFTTPQHPYLTGEGYGGVALTVPDFDNWGSTDHGTLSGFPNGVIVLSNTDDPSWVEYGHGGGIVIVTTLTYGWGGGGGQANPLDNHLKYAPFAPGPQGPSACCFEDASCEMLEVEECQGRNGIPHRFQTCDEIQCAYACCLPDGSCESLSSQACDAQGGIWNEGSACEDVDCTGACCKQDRTCEVLSEQECSDVDGRYNQGKACNEVNCRIGSIAVGGTATTNIVLALTDLGLDFTDFGFDMPPAGSAEIIMVGMDGGTEGFVDYLAYLNGGGHVIVTGGSNWEPYREWARLYFQINDFEGGWHTDGDWHKLVDHPANEGLPDDYAFVENGHTYHMLAFPEQPDTVLLGNNDEPNNVAAFKTFSNGGTFNYMALDLGIRENDQDEFITPWVEAAVNAATGSTTCQYTLKKSKAKGGCLSCPQVGDNLRTEAECEAVGDCAKKIKTTIACPNEAGTCKLKGKRSSCE